MIQEKLAKLRIEGYDFDIPDILKRAWAMFLAQPLYTLAYSGFIFSAQILAVLYLKNFAYLFPLFLSPVLFSGFYFAANKISLGEAPVYPDYFGAFKFYFPIFSIWLVGQILVAIGLIVFIVPGVYLAVAYTFPVLMAVFGGFDFWTALEESRKLVTVRWWKFLLFSLVLLAINVAGFLFFYVGIMLSLPISYFATYILFEDLTRDVFTQEESSIEN